MAINNHPYFGNSINGIITEPRQPQIAEMNTIEAMKELNPTIYNACKSEDVNVLKSICDIQEYKIMFVKIGMEEGS